LIHLITTCNNWLLLKACLVPGVLTGLSVCVWGQAEPAKQPGLVKSEFIFETAPFPSCHASTIAETREGLVAAWFGGTHEKHRDVGIWFSRLQSGNWSAPVEVANGEQNSGERYPCWNPVLFQPKNGPLLLFYKVGPNPSAWWGMLRTSTNSGETWSAATRLPEGILGPIKNKPVQLADGGILCPSSTEDDGWRVHFERTDDLGKTWRLSQPGNKRKQIEAIQPAILVHKKNRLQALGRTEQGRIFETWSKDGGNTWGKMTLTRLPNPNSGIDAVTLKDGKHLLVYNPTVKGRSPLSVAVSTDGKEWKSALQLEDSPGKEFSYPAVIQSADGLVHITYTWMRRRVKHVVVDPARLVAE